MKHRIPLAASALALVSLLAACGNDPGAAANDVASLGDAATTVAGDDASPSTTVDPQSAMLEFTECMRDHGIDMPDPQFTGDGKGMIAISGSSEGDEGDAPAINPESEQFQEAQEACEPIMEAAVGSIEIDPEQQAEMRENLLAFAQCMREHGVDMPDPSFSDDGRVTIGIGGPGGDKGAGAPSAADQETFEAANEACAKDGGPAMIAAAPVGSKDD